ncbi:C2 domain-containing protein [Dichotomocladium elegans]|nr:C2 domain-containing protein [Dichotomocladium elegans]
MADLNGSSPQVLPDVRITPEPVNGDRLNVAATAVAAEGLSPAQKQAKALGQVQDTGLSDAVKSTQEKNATGNLTTDIGTNDAGEVMQAVASASAKPVQPAQSETPAPEKKAPGAFPPAKAGWTAFSQLPNPGDEKAMEILKAEFTADALVGMYKGTRNTDSSDASKDLLGQYLNESYYGEWYHNGAVMLFSVVFTWLLTKLGGGLMMCLVVGAFLATYYQTSMRRLRRNVRDDIQRELMINRLETDVESADWINHFVTRFWLIYEPVLSAQIIGIADAILIENTPSFLDSIRLSTFTLGTKPFRINGIKTYPKTEQNVVCMDWEVSFTPNDILDMSQRDLQSKVNPKIVLTVRVGKGIVGAGMPILLEDLAFSGKLRLKFKFFNEFPHVKTVEASFLEKPSFDYSLKPVGGETLGFDVLNIPGLQSFVEEQVHATLGPMMYAPNAYTVDVAGMMAGTTDLTAANGVLAITVYGANNLKPNDMFGSLDPYVTFHIANTSNPEMARTAAIEDTTNPKWNETHFILLNSLNNDSIYLQVMDRNSGRKDASVGVASFDLKELAESDNVVDGLNLPILRSGKTVGEIKCDMRYFPVSVPEKKEDGTVIPPAESNSGILRFTVNECKGLGGDAAKRNSGLGLPLIGGSDSMNAYAVLNVNGQEKLRTKAFKRSFNPRWDKFVEIFVADKTKVNLDVNIIDSKEFSDDETIGRWQYSLNDMMEDHVKNGQDWWNLKDGAGKIHLTAMWKPVIMTGFAEGLGHGQYRPPIGVARLHFFGARDLKNVEALTGGKSDPYVRVMSGTQIRGASERLNDNLDPDWDFVIYAPVHSLREDLIFEVMDYNDISKDKSLGLHDFVLKDIVKENKTEDGQSFYEPLPAVDRWVDLVSSDRKKGKGRLHYAASFIPIMELPQPKKEEGEGEESSAASTPDDAEAPSTPSPDTAPENINQSPAEAPEKDLHGAIIKYTEDKRIDLLNYESGILTVTIHSANYGERVKGVAELLVDSNDPQYRTVQLKGSELPFNETGDAFVKEMDFSKVTVRIRPPSDKDKDTETIGYFTSSVRDVVRRIMEGRAGTEEEGEAYKLTDSNGAVIRLSFKFTPVVNFKLDPRESLENQGNLTVTPLRASNLPAADRGGTSDPYVVFYIDDVKVYKTEPVMKTTNPVFKDEQFTAPVVNRIGAKLIAEVFDYDQIGKDEFLGRGETTFDGEMLESFAAKDVEITLDTKATLRVRMLWQPQLLARKRTGTTLFGSTTRIFTSAPGAALGVGKDVVGAGVGAGTKVLGTGGKVIGTGVSAIGSGFRGISRLGKKPSESSSDSNPPTPVAPIPVSTTSTSSINRRASVESPTQQRRSVEGAGGSSLTTCLNITLLGARNLKAMDKGGTSDPYARVRMGGKQVFKTRHVKKTLTPEWNESFIAKTGDGKIDIKVKDKNTLNDLDIGDCIVDASALLQGQFSFDGWVPLEPKGTGEVHIRIEQVPDTTDSSSITSRAGGLFGRK